MGTELNDRAGESTILVVEDEATLAETLSYNLELEGYRVLVAGDGPDGLTQARRSSPDLVVLDLMLPGMSGLDVCRALRSESDVPIIILTAKDTEADTVAGLELGADDYMTKPFSMRELIARVRAHLRRETRGASSPEDEVLEGGRVRLDVSRHQVWVEGDEVSFRPKEFELLEMLMRRPGRLLTRDHLLAEIWGPVFYGDPKTLDVHIRRIRQKIEKDPSKPTHVKTVRGLGYRFEPL